MRAYLGLGGNVGDVAIAMAGALAALDAHRQIEVAAVSPLYRTAAWGLTNQPDFLNAAAAVDTSLSARDLLDVTQAAENAHGRIRGRRWGPRTIDIDILYFGNATISEERLKVPHPGIAQRAFVLVPLADLIGDRLPDGRSIAALLAPLDRSGVRQETADGSWWR